MTGPVTITIGVLSASGLDAAQARALGRALETELARLIAAHGLPPRALSAGDRSSVTLGLVTIRADEPGRAGGAVAQAIYRRWAE